MAISCPVGDDASRPWRIIEYTTATGTSIMCSSCNNICPHERKRDKPKEFQQVTLHFWDLRVVVFIVFCSILQTVDCVLVETPANNVTTLGKNSQTTMKCRSDRSKGNSQIKWFMLPYSTSERQDLFDGYGVAQSALSYCDLENGEPGKCNLNLAAKDKAAQTYFCHEHGSGQEASADLILIKKSLYCEKEVTESLTTLKCTVDFRGNWAPVLEWSHLGEVIIDEANTTVVPNEMIISTLIVERKVTSEIYTCTIRFDISGKPQQTTSTNVPDYLESSSLTVEAKEMTIDSNFKAFQSHGANNQEVVIGSTVVAVIATVVVSSLVIFKFQRAKKSQQSERINGAPLLNA